MTNPLMLNLSPGHWIKLANTDVRCPKDRELVNVACWKCGWKRDSDERKETLCGMAEPIWHREVLNTSSVGTWDTWDYA